MFENFGNFFKKMVKPENIEEVESKEAAKERLQLVLMQDRANVSADFLELMKQEIIDVIKKYIEVDEKAIDVRLTTQVNSDGTNGAPLLYANIPIVNIKNEAKGEKNRELLKNENKEVIPTEHEKIEEKIEKNIEDTRANLIDEKILKELNGENTSTEINAETERTLAQENLENIENSKESDAIEEPKKEEKGETPEEVKKIVISTEYDMNEELLKNIDELDFDDDDDDDVTFDDLLKAAEEADLEETKKEEAKEEKSKTEKKKTKKKK